MSIAGLDLDIPSPAELNPSQGRPIDGPGPHNGAAKKIILLKPRGFCAGVVRAIDVVRIALDLYGAPIYVRKEIVHNRHVVDELRSAGAIFVEELSEVPEGAASFSAPTAFLRRFVPKPRSANCRSLTPPARWSRRFISKPSGSPSRATPSS